MRGFSVGITDGYRMKTKLYRPLVDGKRITLLAMSGMNLEQAWAYCYGIFGERFEEID